MTSEEADLIYADCAAAGPELLERLYRDVLSRAFTPAELISLEEFKIEFAGQPTRYCGAMMLEDGRPVAGLIAEYSTASGVLLLGYLAVREDHRSKGIGAALLERTVPLWQERYKPVATLAEIEDPRLHPASQFGDPIARVRLYDRLGARFLPLPYFQPSLASGLPRVMGMLLISVDAHLDGVPATALTAFLDEYIETYEGTAARESDPEYLALRAEVIALGPSVPLQPLTDLIASPKPTR